MPKEMNEDEIRRAFIRKMWGLIEYWEHENRALTSREKLEGLMHSVLATIGGCTDLPSFILAPLPHSSDKQYCIDQGEDYFPNNDRAARMIKGDIGSGLHSSIFQLRPPEHPVETIIKKVLKDHPNA
jgi:hypothetical protein